MPPNASYINFFQVNTTGAEALCELLRSLVGATKETVLLDVCCGTGTLGLSLASSVKRLIGIEMCAPAHPSSAGSAGRVDTAAPVNSTIDIELRRGPASLSVRWPLSAAGDCAAWLCEVTAGLVK